MARANFCCEYCRRPEADSFLRYQVDHIIPVKHGGETVLDNLAYACPICNSYKGTDLGTLLEGTDDLIRIFHPRRQVWSEHFDMADGAIYAKTPIGEATIKLLKLNDVARILERTVKT